MFVAVYRTLPQRSTVHPIAEISIKKAERRHLNCGGTVRIGFFETEEEARRDLVSRVKMRLVTALGVATWEEVDEELRQLQQDAVDAEEERLAGGPFRGYGGPTRNRGNY